MKVIDNQVPPSTHPTISSVPSGTVFLYINIPAIKTDEVEGDGHRVVSLATGAVLYVPLGYVVTDVYPNATIYLHGEKSV